jgi:hypothetical protein
MYNILHLYLYLYLYLYSYLHSHFVDLSSVIQQIGYESGHAEIADANSIYI